MDNTVQCPSCNGAGRVPVSMPVIDEIENGGHVVIPRGDEDESATEDAMTAGVECAVLDCDQPAGAWAAEINEGDGPVPVCFEHKTDAGNGAELETS